MRDVLSYALEHDATTQHWVQGLLDLDGDGRPDFVSSRWDAGNDRPARQVAILPQRPEWLRQPSALAIRPVAVHAWALLAERRRHQRHRERQLHQDRLSFPDNNPTRGYGIIRETYGLVDINGDGLQDFVDGNPWTRGSENGWYVHLNEGDRFGHPVFWPFAGNWQTVHGEPGCTMVLTGPRISETVYGQPDLKFPNADAQGFGYSRQVQGLADIDRDGDPDYWYEEPYRTDEKDAAVCAYAHLYQDEADFFEAFAPRELRRRLLIRRNSGSGFGPPEEWVSSDGYSLSGGSMVSTFKGSGNPAERLGVMVNTGDFNADGALDLAVQTEEGWRTFELTAPNPDVLATITVPTGGVVAVVYRRYYEPGGEMGAPIWVVERVTATDPTGTSATAVRSFDYEHGVFDRNERSFLGFERVYEKSATGYTLSRYYQRKGFEGQLYCREVRADAAATTSLRSMIRTHESAWATRCGPVGARHGACRRRADRQWTAAGRTVQSQRPPANRQSQRARGRRWVDPRHYPGLRRIPASAS